MFAQGFDATTGGLSGSPEALTEHGPNGTPVTIGHVSIGRDAIACRPVAGTDTHQLVWVDRAGRQLRAVGVPDVAGLANPDISPDGRRIAVSRAGDVWIVDDGSATKTKLTLDPAEDAAAVWSPQGDRVVFNSNRTGTATLYQRRADGRGTDDLLRFPFPAVAHDWSSDGRRVLVRSVLGAGTADLWVVAASGDSPARRVTDGAATEGAGQFSPDGRWLLYQSDESGRFEIYVQPLPGPGGRRQITQDGGKQPRWRGDGREIFYATLDGRMRAVQIDRSSDGQALHIGQTTALFGDRVLSPYLTASAVMHRYDVDPSGQRFLLSVTQAAPLAPITLIYNWKPRAR